MRSKKAIILYAVAVFLIVFLITINTVCAITQFEVYYTVESAVMEERAETVQKTLESKYLHKSFLFFDENKVNEVVAQESGGYLQVMSVEKNFPNRITVRVRERMETFAFRLENSEKYYVIGDDGTILSVSNENKNNIAGKNIEIRGIPFGAQQEVGDVFTVASGSEDAYQALVTILAELKSRGMQGNVTAIDYATVGGSDPAYRYSYFYVHTVEGVRFWIVSPEKDTQRKIVQVLDIYASLTDAQRLDGYIFTGSGNAEYSTNRPPELDEIYPET